MAQNKVLLASDNWSPAHPQVIEAIIEANQGDAPAYGLDTWTLRAQEVVQNAFKKKCRVFFVPTGTGANVFAFKLCCKTYESIICTDVAHIVYQESGASEAIVGCKLLTVAHKDGKITPHEVTKKLKKERAFGRHSTSIRVLSISQPTEMGTIYTLEELRALAKLCKEENLYFHMDGSRLYNAAVGLGVGLDEIIQACNLDILSLGGTKNGLMSAEALVIFNSNLKEGSDYLQKQTLQLFSKMRYISAQYISLFKNNLWDKLARQANQSAQEIASIIRSVSCLSLTYPVETNQVFFTAPASWVAYLQEKIHCYLWNEEKNEIRFVASWNTSKQEIESLKQIFIEKAKQLV